MREIKFRAWHFRDKKMYQIIRIEYNLQTDTNLDISKCIFVTLLGKSGNYRITGVRYNIVAVPPEIILLQYTGLKDKNGKEIYEGDIVTVPYINPIGKLCKDTINRKSIIKFKNGGFYECLNDKEKKISISNWQERGETEYICNYGEYTELLDKTVLKVIGNIYENPELLKK